MYASKSCLKYEQGKTIFCSREIQTENMNILIKISET